MSAWSNRAVRLAARTLPAPLRDRYREEWTADVAAAAEVGIRPSSVAVGALVFSATLDRDAPEISGVPIPVRAQGQARWAFAFALVAGILAVSRAFYGDGVQDRDTNLPLAAVLTAFGSAWLVLAVLAIVLALVQLWRAARVSSTLARITAAMATTAFAIFVAGVTIPVFRSDELPVSHLFFPFAFLLLVAALVCGAVAWGASGAPSVAAPVARGGRAPALVVAVLALAVVALGALDLLVLTPLWMAPGFTLAEIYAALSPADVAGGLVMIGGWIVVSSAAAIAFLVRVLLATRRGSGASARRLVLVGLALIAGVVFVHFVAGFSLGMSISDTLPPLAGGMSEYGRLVAFIGQAALVAAVVGAIAPTRYSPQVQPA